MEKPNRSFITGAIALVFAILGYETALIVHYCATAKIIANKDCPDTVWVQKASEPVWSEDKSHPMERGNGTKEHIVLRRSNGRHSAKADAIAAKWPRRVESFRFNPNTVSTSDLVRLGFSVKQAESIDNYRRKGGRFRKKEDFAKSYVVSDSVYSRLEKYIYIPKIDLNSADSAEFDSLPGIGGYFAGKMIEYRKALGGYSFPEQLMDIYHFDREKYEKLKDLVFVSPTAKPFRLWQLGEDSLKFHPYIRKASTARSIVFYREHNPVSEWTVEGLEKAGVLPVEDARKLLKCRIESPQ